MPGPKYEVTTLRIVPDWEDATRKYGLFPMRQLTSLMLRNLSTNARMEQGISPR
jgi:hypothetical protein